MIKLSGSGVSFVVLACIIAVQRNDVTYYHGRHCILFIALGMPDLSLILHSGTHMTCRQTAQVVLNGIFSISKLSK
jgi:hypothetical protein